MEPFDVLNMGNISYFHLEHSNCYLFYVFKFRDPYIGPEKKIFQLWGLWYSKRPAWTHGFNAKIGFEKYAPGPEILSKTSQKSGRQTKPA